MVIATAINAYYDANPDALPECVKNKYNEKRMMRQSDDIYHLKTQEDRDRLYAKLLEEIGKRYNGTSEEEE